jgi:hypothetical protein
LGANHRFDDPLSPYIATGVTDDATMNIGVNVWLGAGCTVIGNVTIGRGSIIGAGSLVTHSIPPFSIAFGNPCRVVKRYDFSTKAWIPVEVYDNAQEDLMPTTDGYRQLLHEKCPTLPVSRHAAAKEFGDLFE